MTKYFGTPFAENGDKATVPDTAATTEVTYDTGYTPEYELAKTDPDRRNIDRQPMNGIFNDITGAIKELQERGYKVYAADVDYPINSYTLGSNGLVYQSIVANGPSSSVVNPVGDTGGTWIPVNGAILAAGTDTYTSPIPSSNIDGQKITVDFVNANTGASTLNGDSVTQPDGSAVVANQLSGKVELEYDTSSSEWRMTDKSIGVGQSWQNMTASRADNTLYTNSTGRPISISVITSGNASNKTVSIDGSVIVSFDPQADNDVATLQAVIPPGAEYRCLNIGAGFAWWELR